DVIEITVALAPAVRAHGTVYQPVPDDNWNGDPTILVPAPATIVEIRDSRNRNQLVLADEQGVYRFTALSTGAFSISARNNNGDQLATAAGVLVGPDGNDNLVTPMILDAGPPRLLSIAPPPGIEGVSRTAVVELVFSEQLLPGVLPVNYASPNHPYFQLRAASGAWPPGTWTSMVDAERHQIVRFTPSAQYENSAIYSLVVAGGPGGVRDRIGRPLTPSGNVGSNFKTADGVGPSVIRTEPDLGRPVDPRVTIRFDFSEAVQATDEQLDGDLSGDAVELYFQRTVGGGTEWQRLPVVTFLTRSNFSLAVQPVEGFNLTGDTLRRRIVLTGLRDVYGNVMPPYERTFRIYDGQAPHVDAVPYPPPSANGQLLQGNRYVLTPALSALDDVTPQVPGGDVDRVEYYFTDPTDPQHPVSPAFSATVYPYVYSFVAAYVGNNVDPRPFPIWVRAVDTSTNASNVVQVAMVVLPNTDPAVETVQVAASAPVPGTPYAGSKLTATVSGFSDLDGSQLTLFIELWQEGAGTAFAIAPAQPVTRPANGWNDAPSRTATFDLPLDIAEGTRLYARARVLDPNGATGLRESEHFAVADDATPPVIDDFSARLAGAPVTHLFIGEEFYLELRARDGETKLKTVALELDRTDLFPGTLTATLVTGTTDLYRTGTLVVPAGMTSFIPIHAKATLADWGGNGIDKTIEYQIGPERDPAAPQGRWKAPWPGALWPAGYESTGSLQGAALLLRLYARDINLDVDGNPIPGRLVSVEVRGPVRNAAGELELASTWTAAQKVPGTEDIAGAIYQALWRVPNLIPAGAEVRFEARLLDSAGTTTIVPMTMTAVAPRQVYEGAITSVGVDDPMLREGWNADGPVFLLDNTTLSVIPRTDGTVRSVPALFLYTGASTESGSLQPRPAVLTAPEITTYDSAILYQPLELAVEHEVGIGVLSRVDMTKKGLLGNTSTRSMVLPGETGAAARAGGSHGGAGWFGSPGGGWNTVNVVQPGSVFDSLRDPRLPGGGGSSTATGSDPLTGGGTGGGVIRLLAPAARVRVDGEIVADGGNGNGGSSGGGAGGAIRLTAARLEGAGRVAARGGAGTNFNFTGGGGGGRIAISYQSLGSTFDLAKQLDTSGGVNDGPIPSRADRRGGAGTAYVEVVDAQTGVAAPGRLLLANPIEPARAALTPLPALGDGAVWTIDVATGVVVLDVPRVHGELVGDRLVLAKADGGALGSFPITAQRRLADASASGGFRVELHVAATAAELAEAASERALGHAVAFHGASRLGDVDAEAVVRLVADDDLLLGPVGQNGGGALNDRAFLNLRRGSRALLRGEAPVVTLTTQPAPGNVILGSSIAVSWTVSDPLGLVETRQESTFAPTSVQALWEEPLAAASTG
ncbi:MAG TPA: Ig-like domain-containing protein, partial [Thermoanaerobaculia bacterium]|nr:Ig-like domain-containing protein [Thermoanaerobaculia bacterium]